MTSAYRQIFEGGQIRYKTSRSALAVTNVVYLIPYIELQYRWQEKLCVALARRHDEVAEWLRRWTANPLGSARVGSNPILVEPGSMV